MRPELRFYSSFGWPALVLGLVLWVGVAILSPNGFLFQTKVLGCVDCKDLGCGSCGIGYKCVVGANKCRNCVADSACGNTPTPTPYAPSPTPVPIDPGSGGGGSNITPTVTVAPTRDPSCASNPGYVYYGECSSGNTNDCNTGTTSTISCDGGSCKYSGNLVPCPNASCPSYCKVVPSVRQETEFCHRKA